MGVLATVEAAILSLHATGARPRRVRVPETDASELRQSLLRTRRGRVDVDPPLHILGIPYVIEGTELVVESAGTG
ncbi:MULTISPECIES: hypothetical protein [Luteimonas]|uniref:hypothetical protein n=1 Tax=Luteimonas TaxID=83614 RepID=UPI000C7C435B|nr:MULTISPECIES: hypothetical protein [Luteimonas]